MATGPIAILPWSDLIEDFLEQIGVTLDDFANEMSGGWLFGYVSALQRARFTPMVVVFSGGVGQVQRLIHRSTGAPIFVLPANRAYRGIRRIVVDPYGFSVRQMFGVVEGSRRIVYTGLRPLIPYLSTPISRLTALLLRQRCSAILCQEYEYARFEACVLVGSLLRLPVFATFQGGIAAHSSLERRLRPLSLRLSAGLLIGSHQEVHRVRSEYGISPSKLVYIPNPIDLSDWGECDRTAARSELSLGADEVVVWHGRVDMYPKGLDVLLTAWSHVVEQRPGRPLRLILLGAGRDAPELRERLEAMPSSRVMWIPEYVLDKRRVARYLSAADIYAFPSRIEGFPVAPLEAMALGLPVVAANAPGVADIFQGGERSGGIVVPSGDPVAFASALGRMLDNAELRRELGRRARQRVEQSFSLEAVGRQLSKLLIDSGVPPGK